MKALTTPLRHTLLLISLTLIVISPSYAAISPELTSALQEKHLTEHEKNLINRSEELQSLYQYLLVDRDLSSEITISTNEIDTTKISASKTENGLSDYISAIIGERSHRGDTAMVDKNGRIRYLEYSPQTQEDINFLSRFKKLNYLSLQSISKDLKKLSLANSTALRELYFHVSQTEKLDFGKGTLPLSTILIRGNKNLKTLVNIKHLENLEYLTVLASTLSDYTELKHNTSLKHLSLKTTAEIKLPDFSNLKNLEYLDITAENTITNISLKEAENLIEARLRPVRLETIELPSSIKILFSDGINREEDLTKLSHLENLEDLSLGYTFINSLKDLPQLNNLKRLELGNNKISSLDGLNRFTKLQELAIYSGNLTNTPDLTKLPNLKTLTLKHHKIEKLCHAKSWKNLKKVNLADNKFEKIDGIRHLTSLEEINLSGNPLREVSQADIDDLFEKGFEGYINVTETEFGSDILYDDEFMKKYYFFEDPKYR